MLSLFTLARRLAGIFRHRREAKILAGLDARMLADIGLNRSDLRDAFSEPVWRDPTRLLEIRAGERRTHRHRADQAAAMLAPRRSALGCAALAGRAARPHW
jgi:uncharacterized protein YjiS (DUF1127 family)